VNSLPNRTRTPNELPSAGNDRARTPDEVAVSRDVFRRQEVGHDGDLTPRGRAPRLDPLRVSLLGHFVHDLLFVAALAHRLRGLYEIGDGQRCRVDRVRADLGRVRCLGACLSLLAVLLAVLLARLTLDAGVAWLVTLLLGVGVDGIGRGTFGRD
jgi:hypothetical protein